MTASSGRAIVRRMARESQKARLVRWHREALIAYNRIQSATRDDRMLSREDRRFVDIPGAQWEGPLLEQFANKPRFEVNRIAQAIQRLESEHRNNRCTVDFVPADGAPSDEVADACDGLYRADEQDSNADDAYDNAFSEAIRGGYGSWRLRACKEDEYDDDNERQRIRIEPIVDADTSVFWDLASKRQDKADARFCFVVVAVPRDEYREQWGDNPDEWGKDETSWPKDTDFTSMFRDWYTPDVVYVAEYYKVDDRREKVTVFKPLIGDEFERTEDDLEPEEDDDSAAEGEAREPTPMERLLAEGNTIVGEKTRRVRCIRKLIMSGGCVLEDCGVIAGKEIPIITCYGKRVFVDNKERWQGAPRVAKDAQRVINMLVSRLAEISSLSTVSKPIFHPEEIDAFQNEWKNDNVKNYAYLRRAAMQGANGEIVPHAPVQYTKPPEVPPALAGLLQVMQIDIRDLLGNQENGEKLASNISGKTVELVQQALDRQAHIYLDNFKKAMKRCGEVWRSMAAEIYYEDSRKMKVVGADGSRGQVTLNAPGVDDGGKAYEHLIDLSRAKHDVVVDVGPSTSTKKQATVRNLIAVLPLIPPDDQTMRNAVLVEMFANLDGVSDLAAYARQKGLEMGVIKPTDEERAQLEQMQAMKSQQPPDPQAQANLAFAEKERNLAAKARADTVLSLANAQKVEAEIGKIKAQTLGEVHKIDRESSQPPMPPVAPPRQPQ